MDHLFSYIGRDNYVLFDQISRRAGKVIGEYEMIQEGDRISAKNIIANLQVGAATGTLTTGTSLTDGPSEITLNVSITGGASWLNPSIQSIGSAGQYMTSPQWNQLGMGRDWVFELMWDFPFKTAVQGLYLDAVVAGS